MAIAAVSPVFSRKRIGRAHASVRSVTRRAWGMTSTAATRPVTTMALAGISDATGGARAVANCAEAKPSAAKPAASAMPRGTIQEAVASAAANPAAANLAPSQGGGSVRNA